MDAALFTKMLSDQSIIDLKKLGYKYPQADLKEFVALLGTGFYKAMPLKDFNGEKLVYLDSVAQVQLSAAKVLLTPQSSSQDLWQESHGEGNLSPSPSSRLTPPGTASAKFCPAMPRQMRVRTASAV